MGIRAVKRDWFKVGTSSRTRESPDDFMRAYAKWLKDNGYEDKPARPTPKAFAILRNKKVVTND